MVVCKIKPPGGTGEGFVVLLLPGEAQKSGGEGGGVNGRGKFEI